MKKPVHPVVVGVVIVLTLVVAGVIFMHASNTTQPSGLKPPPALMEEYQKKGLSMFPTTIPGKYSNGQPLFGATRDHSPGSK